MCYLIKDAIHIDACDYNEGNDDYNDDSVIVTMAVVYEAVT